MNKPLWMVGGVLAALTISFALGKMNAIGVSSAPPPVSVPADPPAATPLGVRAWKLQPEHSLVSITSVKKGKVGEVHYFRKLRGLVSKTGDARIDIMLSSIESRIPIRNKRMKKLLFQVADFPLAIIQARLDMNTYAKLTPGQRIREKITFTLDLHGVTKELHADVFVDVLAGNRVSVSTVKPLIVKASDFKLEQGVAALQAAAKLPSIARAVPVTFNLLFEAEG